MQQECFLFVICGGEPSVADYRRNICEARTSRAWCDEELRSS